MKEFFAAIWRGWLWLGVQIGNVVSSVVLTAFYFSVFALFAFPYRIFGKRLIAPTSPTSNWTEHPPVPSGMQPFLDES